MNQKRHYTARHVPLRKRLEDTAGKVHGVEGQLANIEQMLEQLRDLVIAIVQSERRVRRDGNGAAIAVDMISPSGEVLHSKRVNSVGGVIESVK